MHKDPLETYRSSGLKVYYSRNAPRKIDRITDQGNKVLQ